jgi:hypothetical protein
MLSVVLLVGLAAAYPNALSEGETEHDGPVSRSLLRDLLGEIRKTAQEQASEIRSLKKELGKAKEELAKTKEQLSETSKVHEINALHRELNRTKDSLATNYPRWSDFNALGRQQNRTRDMLTDTPNADDFIELRRDVVSRVHNLTREYLMGMPKAADLTKLHHEINKTQDMVADIGEEVATTLDLKELRGDMLSRVHNITREYLATMPRQSDIHALQRELNTTKLTLAGHNTAIDEMPTRAELSKMKMEMWNHTKEYLERDFLSLNKQMTQMAQASFAPKFSGLKQPPHYSQIDDSQLSKLRANRPIEGWHGWFPALQTKTPTVVVGEKETPKASALVDYGAPKVKASYFDLVRDPKTGEITFWTKEDDTDATPWKQVDKIRVGFEAWTADNKTTTNAQFNGYVSPMPSQQAQARMDAASDEVARLA